MGLRILMVGSFREIALEKVYAHHLKNLDNEVFEFETFLGFHDGTETIFGKIKHKLSESFIGKKINKYLIAYHDKIKPQVALIFKGADISISTLEYLKSRGTTLVNYNPDHPLFFEQQNEQNANIRNGLPFYDLYLSYSKKVVDTLRLEHKMNAEWLPFGFDDRLSTKNNSSSSNSLLFVGAWDTERAKFLSQILTRIDLEIYGNHDWIIRNLNNTKLKNAFQNRYLIGQEYADFVNSSNGVINLLRAQNLREESHNMRTFEVPGYGGILYSQRTEEQESFFEENKEAIFFSSEEELIDKMLFMEKNPAKILKLKQNALERSMKSGYSYTDRSKQLSSMLNELVGG